MMRIAQAVSTVVAEVALPAVVYTHAVEVRQHPPLIYRLTPSLRMHKVVSERSG